eukprot:scaffold59560_cov20-Tisochrysis_lutea.AAC.1
MITCSQVSKVVGCEQGGSAKALSLTVEQGLTRVFVESEVDNVEILGMSKQAIAQNSTSCRGGVRPVQEAPSSADGLPTGELLRHVQQMGGTDFRIHVWVRLIDPAKKCHLQQGEVDGPPQEAASLADIVLHWPLRRERQSTQSWAIPLHQKVAANNSAAAWTRATNKRANK